MTPHNHIYGRKLMSISLLDSPWLSTEEVATLCRVDPSSVRRWRTATPPQGPPFVRLSARRTIYNAQDVENWLRSQRTDPRQAA